MEGIKNNLQDTIKKKISGGEITGPLLVFIILLIIARIFVGPGFFSNYNLFSMLRQIGFIGIVALGETLIILTGGIDLSVGGIASFTGILSSWLMVAMGVNPYLGLVLGLLFGLVLGFINGYLINKLNLNPFIVTLGVMQIYFSLNMVITEGAPITGVSNKILWLGQGKVGFIPVPALIFIVLCIIMEIILRTTKFGRKLYSIGNNDEASYLCGVNVKKYKILVYTLGGFFAALGGLASLARFGSGQPGLGNGWELLAIPAVIIGGGSLDGGKGTAIGTFLGISILTIVSQTIVLTDITTYWKEAIVGAIIILAVLFDLFRKKQ